MKTFPIIIWLQIIFLIACQENSDGEKLHSKSNEEIEKFYSHERDSLKLKAALFLIKNMPYHHFYSGSAYNNYKSTFDTLESVDVENSTIWLLSNFNQLWKKTISKYGEPKANELEVKNDILLLDAENIIQHIDLSFKLWKSNSFNHHVDFNDFCEFILPYRGVGEPIEIVSSEINNKYRALIDSLGSEPCVLSGTKSINRYLRSWFKPGQWKLFSKYPGTFSYSMLNKVKSGKCDDQVNLALYTMRSVGIPVVRDYTPQWANRSMGHSWNSVLLENNRTIDFLGVTYDPLESKIDNIDIRLSKVYRSTFANQPNSLPNAKPYLQDMPNHFRSTTYKDVTDLYIASSDLEMILPDHEGTEVAYISTFSEGKWTPVQWSGINSMGEVKFNKMGNNVVYLPVFYKNNKIVPAGCPILLDFNGTKKTLNPDTTKLIELSLSRKYPMSCRMRKYAERMLNGRFQASNFPDFNQSIDLHVVKRTPLNLEKIDIDSTEAFRYYRYLCDTEEQCDIAEIILMNNDSILKGTIIGTESLKRSQLTAWGNATKEKVFDGNLSTFFSAENPDTGWVGLDLGKKKKVNRIKYMPRNDTNMIEPGCIYELLYMTNEGWISLGKQKANSTKLTFKRVPSNSLFWLRNLTKGKEERVFTYENNTQIWW